MYIKDGIKKSLYDLQQEHPNTSLPVSGPDDSWLEENGYGRYVEPPYTPTPEEAGLIAREQAKVERQALVDAIKVTTSTGKTFDGDETSQGRMARSIIGLQATGQPSLTWVLADNTETQATLAELTEALILAGQAQAAVWVIA